jgi:hypothetical protein
METMLSSLFCQSNSGLLVKVSVVAMLSRDNRKFMIKPCGLPVKPADSIPLAACAGIGVDLTVSLIGMGT